MVVLSDIVSLMVDMSCGSCCFIPQEENMVGVLLVRLVVIGLVSSLLASFSIWDVLG